MKQEKLSLFSDLRYVRKIVTKWDSRTLPLLLASVPVLSLLNMSRTFFAPAVIAVIEKGAGVGTVLAVVAGMTGLNLFSVFLQARTNTVVWQKQNAIHKRFYLLFSEKIMDTDYELLEGPTVREKYMRAKNSLQKHAPEDLLFGTITLASNLLYLLSLGAVIATLHPLIIVYLIAAHLIALGLSLLSDKKVDRTKDAQAKVDRRLAYLSKNARDFAAAKDIRLYRLGWQLKELSRTYIKEKQFWTNKVYLYYFISDLSLMATSILVKGGAYGYLIYKTVTGSLTGGEIVLYFSAMISFGGFLSGLGDSISTVFESNLCVKDFRRFTQIQSVSVRTGGKPLPPGEAFSFELQNVSFHYPGSERMILDGVSFTWRAGEKLALVGLNGAGKTTLVKLLCGLYRPTEGKILLNGTDIAEFNRDEYYTLISAVFQDARMLPLSIASNISMKTDEETDGELLQSCAGRAGLAAKIESLPDGFETLLVKSVNENAVELSGGETQKLLLARALYKDAPIIILDEPTAALDPIAENEMYLKYSALTAGKTSLYISHRLSSTRFCDRIVFLSDGKFAEVGTHDELTAAGGEYARLFEVQSKYYKEEENKDEAE
ncbi:MAG: ABC transporter ATP-binding protein [Clostridia bacterium]|nr:ABC transporter ATP-binding protein [Clostridia bacterium]